MTTNTDAAREQARDQASGRFGEQHLTDPGAGVLNERAVPIDDAVAFINGDLWTRTAEEIRHALRAVGADNEVATHTQIEQAQRWMRDEQLIHSEDKGLTRALEEVRRAQRDAGGRAIKAATLRIRQAHPNVDIIRVTRNPVTNLAGWQAYDADGGPLAIDGDLYAGLVQYQGLIDFADTEWIHRFSTGYRYDGRPPSGATFDDNGRTIAVDVNWRTL